MFDHVGFEVRDISRSRSFYDKTLGALGIKAVKVFEEWGVVGYGVDRPQFWIGAGKPVNGEDELHVAFSAKSRAEVDAFYQAAIKAGGRDNGKPGLRSEYHEHYYGAFVLDPDGHNIEACCHRPE